MVPDLLTLSWVSGSFIECEKMRVPLLTAVMFVCVSTEVMAFWFLLSVSLISGICHPLHFFWP